MSIEFEQQPQLIAEDEQEDEFGIPTRRYVIRANYHSDEAGKKTGSSPP